MDLQFLISNSLNVNMRKVEEKDFDILFNWVNDKEVIKNSRYRKGKTIEEFTEWFNKKLKDKNSYMFILEEDDKYIGQINFEIYKNEAIINYSVDKNFRSQGFGKKLVEYVEKFTYENLKEINKISAYISATNIASIKVFETLNFQREINEEYYVKLVKEVKHN